MSGSLAAVITIPIVTAFALFSWLFAVLWANRHPRWGHQQALPTEVRGGAFQAVEGGRQLMPIPERRPADVPGPRAATASEMYQPSDAQQAGQTAPESARAEESRERAGNLPPR